MNAKEQFEIKEFLRIDACFKLGIMPPEPFELTNATVEQKRKFRKLWRNIVKSNPKKYNGLELASIHPHERRTLVLKWIEEIYVIPAFSLLMNSIDRSKKE